MAKAKKAGFDVATWAETTPHTRRGPQCVICKHPDVAEAVEIIVKARKAGRSTVSIPQVCAMLLEKFGVSVCRTSLSSHAELHLGSKW